MLQTCQSACCVRASMRSARSACLLAARTARCFYHEGLPLAPSSCPSSPSRSRPRSRPCSQQHKGCRTAGCTLKHLLSSAEKLYPQAQPVGCKEQQHLQQQRPQRKGCRVRSTPPTSNSKSKSNGHSNSADRPEVAKGVEAFSWREWEDYSLHPPENF